MPELAVAQEIEHVPIDVLQESEWNPNREDRRTFDALKASIRRNGLVDPLIVTKADNSIIGGHHRLYAVRELMAEGWELPCGKVPVVRLDVTEDGAKRLSLALNKIRGDPDLDRLGVLLRDLREEGDPDSLTATGYTPQEIDDLVELLETGREDLLRAIDDVGDDHSKAEVTEFAVRLSASDGELVRAEFDRLKDHYGLTGRDSDGRALVKMAERSRRLAEMEQAGEVSEDA